MVKYFYCDASGVRRVDSDSPVEGDCGEIISVWESMSREEGTFLGVICDNDLVLQLMWENPAVLTIDIPIPQQGGSMTKEGSLEESMEILRSVATGGDPMEIPGLRFMNW